MKEKKKFKIYNNKLKQSILFKRNKNKIFYITVKEYF